MKFSILSIIVLTFWIALGVQIYIGRQRIQVMAAKREKSQTRAIEMDRDVERLKQQKVDQRVAAVEYELAEVKALSLALTKSLREEVEALSELKVNPEMLSIRTAPRVGRARQSYQAVKVYLPKMRKVGLRVEVGPKNSPFGPKPGEAPSRADAAFGIQGDYPVTVELKPGIRLIECLYTYRDESTSPYFAASIDGEEVVRLVCPKSSSGYSSSVTNWFQQRDYPADRPPPQLMRVTPSGSKGSVTVRLVEIKK